MAASVFTPLFRIVVTRDGKPSEQMLMLTEAEMYRTVEGLTKRKNVLSIRADRMTYTETIAWSRAKGYE